MSLIITKVGPYRGTAERGRVFSESLELSSIFSIGEPIVAKRVGAGIRITPADVSTLSVAKRKRRGQDAYKAVIDLHPKYLPSDWEVGQKLQIIIDREARSLYITLAPVEEAVRERRSRLQRELQNGKMSSASLYFGGGIFAHATHEGAAEQGIRTALAYAVERDVRYTDCARENNPALSADTELMIGNIQDINPRRFTEVSHMEIGLPCESMSRSAGAMRASDSHSANTDTGHLYIPTSLAITLANPAFIQIECVPKFLKTEAWACLRQYLRDRCYDIFESLVSGGDVGTIENRRRCFIVAACRSLNMKDPFIELKNQPHPKGVFGEVMEQVPTDDPSWSTMAYLDSKQERDQAAGKGFMQRYADASTTKIAAVKKSYHKRQSDGVYVRHPDGKRQRLLTISEQAAIKDIPVKLVANCNYTVATQILGQSGIHRIVKKLVSGIVRQMLQHFSSVDGERAPATHASKYKATPRGQLALL